MSSNKHIRDGFVGKKGIKVLVNPHNRNLSEKEQEKALENALRTFKKLYQSEGIHKDLKKHEFHETKGQRNRRRKAESIRRNAKKLRMERQFGDH